MAEAKHSAIGQVSEVTPCTRVWPGTFCNALMMINVSGNAGEGNKYITWRANWSDNDGSIAGGDNYTQYTGMYVIIQLNATLDITNYSVNRTIQHGAIDSFTFQARSVSTDSVTNINISYIPVSLQSSWINISPLWINGLAAGQTADVTVNITVPIQTASGNYSGIINASSANGGEKYLNLTVEIPLNTSWSFVSCRAAD